MELPKKICSLGILDINLNLELFEKEAYKYNFNINKYNSVEDLKTFLEQKNGSLNKQLSFNILEHISLTSDNNLINTLLFINRAYKNKSFIEFIMPNQLKFSEKSKFIFNLINYVLDKNYFFIVENKIWDIPSSIKFIIKIYKDNSNEIIKIKEFQLFEMNDNEIEINDNINNNKRENNLLLNSSRSKIKKNIFNEINYNFSVSDYFILDLNILNSLLMKNKIINNYDYYNDLILFLKNIIKQNNNIKIITIFSKSIFKDRQLLNNLENYKEIIEFSDIIFTFKQDINYFYQEYYSKYNKSKNFSLYFNNKNKITENMLLYEDNNKQDLIKDLILDDKDKIRKNIPRISLLFNEFNYISVYIQNGINLNLDYIEVFFLNYLKKLNDNYELINNLYYYCFIGGFLSRFIYNKSFKICISAGQLLVNKIIKSNLIKFVNVDDYNIIVPNKKNLIIAKKNKQFKILDLKDNNFNFQRKISNIECNTLFNNYKNYLFNNNLSKLNKLGSNDKIGIILKESNNENLNKIKKNNLLCEKSNNKFNKSNSMINIFGKRKIKRILMRNNNLPKMPILSTPNIFYLKNKNNSYIYSNNFNKYKSIKIKKRPKSKYSNRNEKNNFKKNNLINNNKLFSPIKIINNNKDNPITYKYYFRRSNSMIYNN